LEFIVVTGGAGFIGSCLVSRLNEIGFDNIIIVDTFGSTDKWKNLVGKKFIEFIPKNEFLPRISEFTKSGNKIKAIFHLGACSSTTELNSDYLFDNNFRYSKTLFEFALENSIRFIYASSAATYGLGESGYSDNNVIGLKPLNPYGFSKQLFDEFVIYNYPSSDFVGLKFFNVFGPNEYHKNSMASMIYKSYLQIKDGNKVKLFKSNSSEYKDGMQQRDFIYVKDAVDAIIEIWKSDYSGILNLGTGKARTWKDLVNAVFKAMDVKSKIEFVDMPVEIASQYQNFTEADMTNFSKIFPDFKFMELEKSISDYVSNYLLQDWKNL